MTTNPKPAEATAPLRECLSAIEHEQWMHWSQSVAKSMELGQATQEERITAWKKFWIPYTELSESAKELDRVWADKVIDAIESLVNQEKRDLLDRLEQTLFHEEGSMTSGCEQVDEFIAAEREMLSTKGNKP